ncbi:MAG: UPF0158 family protein [Nitrospirota bacterium]
MSTRKQPIKLRGHHLICLHFFRGEGYNPEFVENLWSVLKRAEAGEPIEVAHGADDVCGVCPSLKEGKCLYRDDAEKEIREMDRTSLKLLDLDVNETVLWSEIRERVPEVFLPWARTFCRECGWSPVCRKDPVFKSFSARRLGVNFDEIQKAMEDVVRDNFDYFLDLETGEVVTFSEEIVKKAQSLLYVDEGEELEDDIDYIEFDEDPELPEWMIDQVETAIELVLDENRRYVRIPERSSSAAFESMSGFIQTVSDPALKSELTAALSGRGAFRRFKDVLVHCPKERKRWHSHNAKAMKKEIKSWLHAIGVASVSRSSSSRFFAP